MVQRTDDNKLSADNTPVVHCVQKLPISQWCCFQYIIK